MNPESTRQRARAPLTPRLLTRLLALFATLALVAAACGSDDAETTDAGTTGDDAGQSSDGDGDGDSMDDDAMDDMDDDAMDDMDGEHGDHDHDSVIEVPEGMAVPQIDIRVEPDPKSGMNLFVELTDFEIAPESASTDPVDGEGHLHLYIDGERQGRFYNEALHLAGLSPGEHEIAVEVSANNHSPYAVDGEPIWATQTVTVPESEGGHSHDDGATFDVDAASAPTVAVEVFEDPKSGWNLFIDVSGFEWAPESASTEAVDGEGHAHLYVDGEKQGRIYGPWWHLSGLDEGDHEIMIELSANDHAPYAVDGEPIVATTTISVSAEQAAGDGHSHGDGDEHGDDAHGDDEHGDSDEGHGDDDEHGDSDEGHGDDEHGHGHGTGEQVDGDPDVTIEAIVADGQVSADSDRVDVPLNSIVRIIVEADITEEVHLHGYDILVDVSPDENGVMTFLADTSGVFEVELETSGKFLFEIAVGR